MKEYRVMFVTRSRDGAVPPQAAELLTGALILAGGRREDVLAVVEGPAGLAAAKAFSATAGVAALAMDGEGLRLPDPMALARALSRAAERHRSVFVILPHSAHYAQCAAVLAAGAGWLCVTGIDDAGHDEGGPFFTRPVFNGRIRMTVRAGGRPAAVTALAGSWPAAAPGEEDANPPPPPAMIEHVDRPEDGALPLSIESGEESESPIEDADVIVAAGRGIGREENLALVRELASIFPGSAVGASRPLCDNRWLPYSRQVGATGRTVRPRLYIACGISGSQQHIAGMKGSQCVVAINRDPRAAIFSVADYIVVEDLVTFIPVLVETHRLGSG